MNSVGTLISLTMLSALEGMGVVTYYDLAAKKPLGGFDIDLFSPLFLMDKFLFIGEQKHKSFSLLQKWYFVHMFGVASRALCLCFGLLNDPTAQNINRVIKAGLTLLGGVTTFSAIKEKPKERGKQVVLSCAVVLAALETFCEGSSRFTLLRSALGIGTGAYTIYFHLREMKSLFTSQEGGTKKKQATQ